MSKLKYIFLIFGFILALLSGCVDNKHNEVSTEISGKDVIKNIDLLITLNYNERQGKQLFDNYCVICHGKKGKGDGFNAFNLNPNPQNLQDSLFQAKISDLFLNQVLALGGRGVNKSSLMPAYNKTLSKNDIGNIISYIRKLNYIKE